MKAVILTIGLMLGMTSLMGQERPSRERIHQLKSQFLTQELELSAQEAEVLMPILEELEEQRVQLWRALAPMRKRIQRGDTTLTQAELEEHFDQQLKTKIKEAELEQIYYARCKGKIPARKLVRLSWANRRFAAKHLHPRGKHN